MLDVKLEELNYRLASDSVFGPVSFFRLSVLLQQTAAEKNALQLPKYLVPLRPVLGYVIEYFTTGPLTQHRLMFMGDCHPQFSGDSWDVYERVLPGGKWEYRGIKLHVNVLVWAERIGGLDSPFFSFDLAKADQIRRLEVERTNLKRRLSTISCDVFELSGMTAGSLECEDE